MSVKVISSISNLMLMNGNSCIEYNTIAIKTLDICINPTYKYVQVFEFKFFVVCFNFLVIVTSCS